MHFPLFSNTVPSGQTQATDLLGWESMTTQRWSNWQGLFTVQGFWQVWDIHASLDGQSWSTRHSGSSATIAKQEKGKVFNLAQFEQHKMLILSKISLRSLQEIKPSPFRGGLQVHSSMWLFAEQIAPRTHLGSTHKGRHSFLWAPLGKSHFSLLAQSACVVHLTSMQATRSFPCNPGGQ